MSEQQMKAIAQLRDAGYVVAVWSPEELKGMDPNWLYYCVQGFGADCLDDMGEGDQ